MNLKSYLYNIIPRLLKHYLTLRFPNKRMHLRYHKIQTLEVEKNDRVCYTL